MGVSSDLEQALDRRRLGMVRVLLGVAAGAAGAPYWELSEEDVLCLTWQRGDLDVVMLVPRDRNPVLYKGRVRVPNAGGVELADAIRWLRAA